MIMNHIREPLVELDLRGQIVSNQTGRSGSPRSSTTTDRRR